MTLRAPSLLFTSGVAINEIARNKHQKTIKSPGGIVRLTVERFISRENNLWLGWKWITQNKRTLDGKYNGGWSIWAR